MFGYAVRSISRAFGKIMLFSRCMCSCSASLNCRNCCIASRYEGQASSGTLKLPVSAAILSEAQSLVAVLFFHYCYWVLHRAAVKRHCFAVFLLCEAHFADIRKENVLFLLQMVLQIFQRLVEQALHFVQFGVVCRVPVHYLGQQFCRLRGRGCVCRGGES